MLDTLQSYTILLVDDDQDDQFFFRESLSQIQADIRLSVANNDHEAEKYLTTHVPDFIFLDINMPVVTGKDSLRRIRGNKKFDHVKIIMLTTSSNKKDIDDCFELGANLYVQKPSTGSEHIAILKKIFMMHKDHLFRKISKNNFVFQFDN